MKKALATFSALLVSTILTSTSFALNFKQAVEPSGFVDFIVGILEHLLMILQGGGLR
ncbi:MAG: hypothetical protein MI684_05975 [Chlorobiales bacterium]|nr:hypothetical protein [Chlorobiales bacterium]